MSRQDLVRADDVEKAQDEILCWLMEGETILRHATRDKYTIPTDTALVTRAILSVLCFRHHVDRLQQRSPEGLSETVRDKTKLLVLVEEVVFVLLSRRCNGGDIKRARRVCDGLVVHMLQTACLADYEV